MKLLYITDVSQVDYLLNNFNEFESYTPITGDISSAFVLQNNFVDFINEWDYLRPELIQKNWDLANNFSENWWNEIHFNIPSDLKQYFIATSQDMVFPLEVIFNSKTVYEDIFKRFQIEELAGFFLENNAILRTGPIPTHRAARSIAQAILFWIADCNGIPYVNIEMKFQLTSDKLIS
jgi:hypothetical protein